MWDFSNIFLLEPLSDGNEYFYCYLHSYNEGNNMHYACFSDKYCIVKFVYEFNANDESGRVVSNQINEGKLYIEKSVLLRVKNFCFANDVTEEYENIFTIKDGKMNFHFELLNENSSEYFKRGEWYDKYIQVLPYKEFMKEHRPDEKTQPFGRDVFVVYLNSKMNGVIYPLFRMFYNGDGCYGFYDPEIDHKRIVKNLTHLEFYDMLAYSIKTRSYNEKDVKRNTLLRALLCSEQIKEIISKYNQDVWEVDSFVYNGIFSLILINKQDNTFEKYRLEGDDFIKVNETLYNKQLTK